MTDACMTDNSDGCTVRYMIPNWIDIWNLSMWSLLSYTIRKIVQGSIVGEQTVLFLSFFLWPNYVTMCIAYVCQFDIERIHSECRASWCCAAPWHQLGCSWTYSGMGWPDWFRIDTTSLKWPTSGIAVVAKDLAAVLWCFHECRSWSWASGMVLVFVLGLARFARWSSQSIQI